MKKIVILFLVLTMTTGILCACSNNNSDNSTKEDATSASVSDESINDMELTDLTFKLDGVTYTLPCDFSEFEKNGWTIASDSDYDGEQTIASNEISQNFEIKKSDGSYPSSNITIGFLNSSSDSLEIKKCKIGKFSFSVELAAETPNNPDIIFAGGLVVDKSITVDDITSKYGEPSNSENNYYLDDDGNRFPATDMFYQKADGDYLKTAVFTIGTNDEAMPHKYNEFTLEYINAAS